MNEQDFSGHVPTLTAASVNMILHIAVLKGAEKSKLCKLSGIDEEIFQDLNARIPIKKVQTLWRKAIEETGDEELALHLGESINPASAGIIAYVMMNCPTLGESINKLCKYQDIICEGVKTYTELIADDFHLSLKIISEDITEPKNVVNSELAIYSNALNHLIGRIISYKKIIFEYPKPDNIQEITRFFKDSPLEFNAGKSALVFDKSYLKLPVVNANPELNLIFEKYANDYLNQIKQEEKLSSKVNKELVKLLKGQEPDINKVARNLALGVRNLQIKLKEEGTSFQTLLDQVRKEIALRYLDDPNMNISDLAYLLGFSEASVFYRSFKKWTGLTPGLYREKTMTKH